MDETLDIDGLILLAEEAGRAIMQFHRKSFAVSTKADHSPLTEADLASNKILVRGLAALTPNIPIISEEGTIPDRLPNRAWLVDPLDGTLAFTRGSDEFTINLGLAENNHAIFGLIHHPSSGDTYVGGISVAPFVIRGGVKLPLSPSKPERLRIIKSASHPSAKMKERLAQFPGAEVISMSGAIKFCYLADGRADHYPRFGRTMEWDTAAGQAIVEAMGGRVETLENTRLIYGKPKFENHGFMAYGAFFPKNR